MATKTMKVGYRLVRNATSTAEKAPYLGVAVPVGSLAYDNILQRMLDRGTFMTRATAQYFLNAFYEYAAERIAEDVVRINMGAVSLYPMIGGSFDSEDDEFLAPRNTLYVGATLSQEIRDAVSGIAPASLGAEAVNGTVKISSVMDLASETYRLIDGLKEFRIAGIDLTVPDGEDESLALVATDGLTKAADITVVSTEDGQRIVCTLASAVPAGTYYVRLVSHGLDPTAPLVTALHKVTVKAAATPPVVPAPTLTGINSPEQEDRVIEWDAPIEMHGTNLMIGVGDKVEAQLADTEESDRWYSVFSYVDGENSTAEKLVLGDGVWDVLGPDLEVGTEHNAVRFRVTTAGGSAAIVGDALTP